MSLGTSRWEEVVQFCTGEIHESTSSVLMVQYHAVQQHAEFKVLNGMTVSLISSTSIEKADGIREEYPRMEL